MSVNKKIWYGDNSSTAINQDILPAESFYTFDSVITTFDSTEITFDTEI
ncbi:MAG TPA: hypothetical protein VFM70_02700 [Salinimicrobium sp.]|nr:hypothetical protein [Salinimicrobium sp.]